MEWKVEFVLLKNYIFTTMSPLKKRKMKEIPQEDNSDVDNKEVQATFEGRNLEEFDFQGIKQLLHQLFLKAPVDLTQLTDTLISQSGVGSVLKQIPEDDEDDYSEEDEGVFGITTVLNLTAYKNTPCVQQLNRFINEQVTKYGNKEVQDKFKDVLTEIDRIGLIINERFLNLPATISAPMLTSLVGEIEKMKKRNSSYDFQKYLMICKTYRMKKTKDEMSFSNEEECIFASHADSSIEYDVSRESDVAVGGKWGSNDSEILPCRKILLISANKLNDIISQITTFVNT